MDLTDVAAATPTVTLEAPSPRAEAIRAGYTKYEYRVPMRDGVRLFTAVYVPNDASAAKTYPMLMVRTPYSVAPYGIDRYKGGLGPTEAYEKEGFIFVFQDVRGAHMSEGEFVDMRPHNPAKRGSEIDESSDTHDSIDWLLAHVEHHNGKVGQWGEPFRGRYRESYEQPLAFVPGQPARVAFPINDVFHTFKRGHRLMVQVQSSWFPFIDRNPQFAPDRWQSAAATADHRRTRRPGPGGPEWLARAWSSRMCLFALASGSWPGRF